MKRLFILSCIFWEVIGQQYSYDAQDKWFGLCTHGQLQSPIPLTSGININVTYPSQNAILYDTGVKARVINNGHDITVMVSNDTFSPVMWSGGLPGFYTFRSMHFHWGAEHTVDGKRYPLEAHVVHFRSMYKSFKEAVKHPGGVAVYAIHFEISSKPRNLDYFLEAVQKLKGKPKHEITIDNFVIDDFSPAAEPFFFSYKGSLTTPPCTENVLWTVFKARVPISHKQLKILRGLKDEKSRPFAANFRKLQKVNNRVIYEGVYDLSTLIV